MAMGGVPDLPPLQKWLKYLDGETSKEAIDLVKLSLCSEMDKEFEALQGLNTVSQIYNYLSKHRPESQENEALQLLISAITCLTGDLHGDSLVSMMCNFGLTAPVQLEEAKKSEHLKFHLFLASMAAKIHGTDVETRLKCWLLTKFSPLQYTMGLHDAETTLALLLMRLITGHHPVLKWNDTKQLVEAFNVCGGRRYLHHLNQYRSSVGLPLVETPIAESSTDATSSSDTGDDSTGTWPRSGLHVTPNPRSIVRSLKRKPVETRIAEWLRDVVDKKISQESVGILKLGIRGQLSSKEIFEMIQMQKPSQLYDLLKRSQSSSQSALSRFILALKQLGHHRNGRLCVRQLCGYGVIEPQPFNNRKMLDRFSQFLQCLALISARLKGFVAQQLIAYFTQVKSENYTYITSADQLFITLLNDDVITDQDQTALYQSMLIVGARGCLKYINQYREDNRLPPIQYDKHTLRVNPISDAASSIEEANVSSLKSFLIPNDSNQSTGQEEHEKATGIFSWFRKKITTQKTSFKKTPTMHKINDLTIFRKKVLGSGSFGCVFLGQKGQLRCAVKVLHPVGMDLLHSLGSETVQLESLERFNQECNFLKSLQHRNIVSYFDTILHPQSNLPVLVLELLDCSLTQYLSNHTGGLPIAEQKQMHLSDDIAEGLEYLHKHEILHRDLCTDNVLLKLEHPIPSAKITDFGYSRLIDCTSLSVTLSALGHRAGYMPSEAVTGHYDFSLDIFMLGVVITQIVQNESNIKSVQQRDDLISQISEVHPLKRIILCCVRDNPEERYNATDVSREIKKRLQSVLQH